MATAEIATDDDSERDWSDCDSDCDCDCNISLWLSWLPWGRVAASLSVGRRWGTIVRVDGEVGTIK